MLVFCFRTLHQHLHLLPRLRHHQPLWKRPLQVMARHLSRHQHSHIRRHSDSGGMAATVFTPTNQPTNPAAAAASKTSTSRLDSHHLNMMMYILSFLMAGVSCFSSRYIGLLMKFNNNVHLNKILPLDLVQMAKKLFPPLFFYTMRGSWPRAGYFSS